MNPFQKAFLNFCRIGITTNDQIADYLKLDPELIRLVAVELEQLGLVTRDSTLTAKGLKGLTEALDEIEPEPVSGYVFQDPWTGKLLPRFMEKLHYAILDDQDDERVPRLVFGSKGKARFVRPFIKGDTNSPTKRPPTPADILAASRAHRRDLARNREADIESEDQDEISVLPIALDSPALSRTALITEKAQPVYLLTYLYVPEAQDEENWYVCDPFALGAGGWLYREIARHRRMDTRLDNFINEYILEMFSTGKLDDSCGKQLMPDDEIRHQLIKRFGLPSENRKFFAYLVSAEHNYRHACNATSNKEAVQIGFLDAMLKMGIALEACLQDIQKQYPAKAGFSFTGSADATIRQEQLEVFASRLGFKSIPQYFMHIPPEKIRSAAWNSKGSLGEMLLLLLLSAHAYPDHPLKRLAETIPDALEQVAAFVPFRNAAAHANTKVITLDDMQIQRQHIYTLIQELSGFITETSASGAIDV
jgi:hypothetical protein